MKRHREPSFVAATEMAEILANEKLLLRLRAGSAQAAARQGAFVRLAAALALRAPAPRRAAGWKMSEQPGR
jgi:hypothetical protein